jgi:hypothetical protein
MWKFLSSTMKWGLGNVEVKCPDIFLEGEKID